MVRDASRGNKKPELYKTHANGPWAGTTHATVLTDDFLSFLPRLPERLAVSRAGGFAFLTQTFLTIFSLNAEQTLSHIGGPLHRHTQRMHTHTHTCTRLPPSKAQSGLAVLSWPQPLAVRTPTLTATVQLHGAADKNHHLPLEGKAAALLKVAEGTVTGARTQEWPVP